MGSTHDTARPSPPGRGGWVGWVAGGAGIIIAGGGLLLVAAWWVLPVAGWSGLVRTLAFSAGMIVMVVAATIVGIAIHRRNRPSRSTPELGETPTPSIESRLTDIDHLLATGRIDQHEYAAIRSRILDLS